jgi:hypothetical protein
MAAIITDQLRILNAKNFVAGVQSSSNSYYAFIGLPNPASYQSDWDTTPPSPKDSLNQSNEYWDTMLAMKKIAPSDCNQVVSKNTWQSGITYAMWRNDISISNPSEPGGQADIYAAKYYVMNSDYRVYTCLYNNAKPENNHQGGPSLDEPTFTDLEPREAGSSGDGYIWKYLYTIRPSQAIKFESTNYIPVPSNWETNTTDAAVRENASTSGQLKIVTVRNRGVGIGTANLTYTNVPIHGDGNGAKATIVINNDSKVDSITISQGGSGYTYGTVDLSAGGVPTGTTSPEFNVIIPPAGGYGSNIYSELGAFNVLTYARFENDTNNPDFITGNQFARVGFVCNPLQNGSSELLADDKISAVYALRLTGIGYSSANFTADSKILQTVGLGSTAVGRVVSYDQTSGVLKYWQDRTNNGFTFAGAAGITTLGYKNYQFTAAPGTDGNLTITGGDINLSISTQFNGITTVINSKTYNLGQNFVNGVSQPESQKYSGKIIYVDNRPSVTRSSSQKEDVKIILEF